MMKMRIANVSYRFTVVVIHQRAARHSRDGIRAIHRSSPPQEEDKSLFVLFSLAVFGL